MSIMEIQDIITGNGIRILRPDEYHALMGVSKKLSSQVWPDAEMFQCNNGSRLKEYFADYGSDSQEKGDIEEKITGKEALLNHQW